jgi:hypothetical protein
MVTKLHSKTTSEPDLRHQKSLFKIKLSQKKSHSMRMGFLSVFAYLLIYHNPYRLNIVIG